jgi:hypothetical protein
MEKQTAVEWFAIQLKRIGVTEELIGHLTKEAKEMEKQQIIYAYHEGVYLAMTPSHTAEQYYKETYNNETTNND